MIYSDLKPQNLPEKLIWYYLVCTYPIYYLGGQYLLAPLLGCFLALYLAWQWWHQTPATPLDEQITIPVAIWVWIVGILMIEVALIIGHFDFNLGLGKTISSTVNRWVRTWMLFPVFMLAGSLKIRPQLIYRGVCIVCIQSLLMAVIASGLNLPDVSYTSPLRVFGGGNFYHVNIFGTLLDSGELRLILFAPWSPALGLVANVYFCLASQEKNPTLKWLGIMGAIAMIVGSVSRLAIICLPLTLIVSWFLLNIHRPVVQLGTGLVGFISGFLAPTIIHNLQLARAEFSQARVGSSRVRTVLGKIALYRWQQEAFFWGHGSVGEHGPKVTGRMAIGTHHTWFSILYTHGLIGCLGLAVPLAWSLVELVFKAQTSQIAKVGLQIILVLIIFSGGENIDSLTYLYWPGLLILGISFKNQISNLAGTENHLDTKNLLTLGV